MSELVAELPQHLALFACGVLGWSVTRWANERFCAPRHSDHHLAKMKFIEIEDNEDFAEEPCDTLMDETPAKPVQQTTSLSAATHRRAGKRKSRNGVANIAAADEDSETLIGTAKVDEEPPSPAVPLRMASREEPEPELLVLPQNTSDSHDGQSDATSSAVSDRVTRLLAKAQQQQQQQRQEQQRQLQAANEALASVQHLSEQSAEDCDVEKASLAESEIVAHLQQEQQRSDEVAALDSITITIAAEVSTAVAIAEWPQWTEEDEHFQGLDRTTPTQPWAPRASLWVDEEEDCAWAPRPERSQRSRAWTEPSQGQDGWMVHLDQRPTEAFDGPAVQAMGSRLPIWRPLLSEEGQQLHTDGEQLYMLVGVEVRGVQQ
mmetsp:Transcript_183544/g.582194  ORF Transcript_183544/g.582194 Transcript_183544/m.582194 type:complete len:376 (-) Transcript_183544:17-1144(-)